MARKRRRSLRRKKPNLMLHRTRNLGVVGTRGAGLIAFTKGAFTKLKDPTNNPYLHLLFSEQGEVMLMEDGGTPMISER